MPIRCRPPRRPGTPRTARCCGWCRRRRAAGRRAAAGRCRTASGAPARRWACQISSRCAGLREGEVDDEPQPPQERLVHVVAQVAGEDRDALVVLHPLQQVADLDVGVAVVRVGHLGAACRTARRPRRTSAPRWRRRPRRRSAPGSSRSPRCTSTPPATGRRGRGPARGRRPPRRRPSSSRCPAGRRTAPTGRGCPRSARPSPQSSSTRSRCATWSRRAQQGGAAGGRRAPGRPSRGSG